MSEMDRPIENLQPGPAADEELSLRDILRVTLTHSKLILWTAGIVLGLGLLYAFLWPKTYEVTTTVKVPDNSLSPQGMLKSLDPFSGSGDPIQTYVEIAQSQSVAGEVVKGLHLAEKPEYRDLTDQEVLEKLLKHVIKVSNVKTSNVLSIAAKSHDPKLAADLANAWAAAFISVNLDLSHKGAESKRIFLEGQVKEIKEKLNNPDLRLNDESKADEVIYAQLLQQLQQAQIEEKVDDAGIVVMDEGQVPEKAVWPKKAIVLILALLLGPFLGLQAAFILERLQDRVKDEETLKRVTGLPNYAVIPDFWEDFPEGLRAPAGEERFSPKYLIHNPVFDHSFYRECFKTLRTNLTLAQADKPLKAFAVLSPGPEEGKSLVNANVAIALAQGGKKVLLVDTDLRKSSVRKVFGLENGMETGLPLALTGQKAWKDMIRPSGVEGLDLLPNTVTPPDPAELLGSAAMKKLIGEMKEKYDFVVFDGAPVIPVTDSVVLSTMLDGVVLMSRFNHSHSSNVRNALEHLRRVGTHVVGTVLNYVPIKKGLYRYGYGYGGYRQYRYGPEEAVTKRK
ncbi:MAG TPA: polysaccharide biosynthesis tyrosine autokinase [bacterium]|nr:polysaccharide biosynthesis tyrosine autokinase [bacterium]